jgi:multidrug resistance efflux pump
MALSTPPLQKFVLPETSDPNIVGGRWVSRAVTITLSIFAVVLAGFAVVANVVKLKVTVDGVGMLQPTEIWSIRSQETGVVRDVLVRTGDSVRAGQAIAYLDTVQLASSLEQLRARRRALEHDLRLARTAVPLDARAAQERRAEADAELVRTRAQLRQRLVEYGFEPDLEELRRSYRLGTHIAIDQALASLMTAEAAARNARIELDRLGLKTIEQGRQQEQLSELDSQISAIEQRISHLTLHAPAAGIVLTDGLERLPGKMLQGGETLLEISKEDDWRAALLVAERDVSRIRVGDSAQVELKAFGRTNSPEIRGNVLSVGAEPAGEAQAGNRMFPVLVRLSPEDLEAVGLDRLRRGYTAQAKIVTRDERMITLIWEYLLRRSEEIRERSRRRVEQGARRDSVP